MIGEYILKKALDASLDVVKKVLRESKTKLLTTRDELEQSIYIHLKSVKNWSGEVSFSDIKQAKRTTDVYIELDLYVYPIHRRISRTEQIENVPLLAILEGSNNHFVLLGQPGAGKTTSMKYICQKLFYSEDYCVDRFSFPILIKLRDLNNAKRSESSIFDVIYRLLGLKLEFPEDMRTKEASADRKALKEKLVITVLEGLNVLLILDGFDELAQAQRRRQTIQEIRSLVEHLDRCTLIVTSRVGDFKYNIENMVPYEISPLSREQISVFALRWLNDNARASDFLNKVYDSPFADTAIRPLTLAHLCAIYDRVGKIPDKPKTIYRKIVNLLLEEWDQQRSVVRVSSYANFEVDRKFEFLCHLAYVLTTLIQKTVFSEDTLLKIYHQIYEDYDLAPNEAQQVVNELESHTGLFIQSGYEEYEFAHKSLQEFMTAEYLVKLPSIPAEIGTLLKLPYELAVAITISSSPSEYFSELIFNRLRKHKLSEEFVRSFVSRLLLEKPDFNSSTKLGMALIMAII
jgi:predicted NACHT family NTPase